MVNKNQLLRRLIALACVLLVCASLAGWKLTQLQLVHGEENVKKAAVHLTTITTVSAARGEILDRYGRPLVTNRTAFSMVLTYSNWQTEGQFDRLLELTRMVEADGGEVKDVMPISKTAPYTFTAENADEAMTKLRKYMAESENKIHVGNTATAPEFIEAMRVYLKLPDTYSQQDVRTVVGLYYSMRTVGFDMRQNFTLATDVTVDLIAKVKENHKKYAGVDFQTESMRQYDTEYAAHLLGTVHPMWTEDWDGKDGKPGYKEDPRYNMNDSVGDSGIEKAMESYLHGTSGSTTVETTLGGDNLSGQTNSYAPEPGNNVVLTIDLELQKAAEQSLAENVSGYGHGGAAVVLDVHSGEVLAMASYPTYNLATFNKEYEELEKDSRKPFTNRATSGLYAPGSTFKVLSAIAALETGVIDENTSFTCTGKFEYGGQTFKCNNHEQPATYDVVNAIKYSCNTFFYNVGQQLTGAALEKWCKSFGLGQVTGIEVGELAGQAAGPETREKMLDNDPTLREWQGGDDVQAAIGQSDNWFTPLQLCNYIAAVVNGGTVYKPTLVKNVKSYDYGEVVKTDEPEILGNVTFSDKTRDTVMTGMAEVTAEGGTAATVFANYPIKIGGKTGTAETNDPEKSNGVFIAFGPFEDAQIAVCVVGEAAQHGASVAPVVRDIFDAYFKTEPDLVETVEKENALLN